MYEFKSRVRHSEINEYGLLSIPSIMRYMTDCCMFHSIEIDYDLKRLQDAGEGWYVTMWQVDIKRRPQVGDDIIIKTWPYKFRGMIGFRNFSIETPDGEELVTADSMWVYMNIIDKKPKSVPLDMAEGFCCEKGFEQEWLPRKIRKSDGIIDKQENLKEDYIFEVMQQHIDTNHHMNNACYIEAAMEGVEDDSNISYIRAEYKNVAYKGDKVRVAHDNIENGVQTVLFDENTEFAVVEVLTNN